MKHRLFSLVIAFVLIASFTLNAYAYVSPFTHGASQTPDEPAGNPVTIEDTWEAFYSHLPAFRAGEYPAPADYDYIAFTQIFDLYADAHLYEFSKEELLQKFLYDLLEKSPELFDYLLNTLLGTMDPYSAYYSADSGFLSGYAASSGFGVVISDVGDALVLINVLRDSPAERCGLMVGDRLVRVMGMDVSALPLGAVSHMLHVPYLYTGERDENGKYVTRNPLVEIVVDRAGTELSFTLTREILQADPLTYEYYEETGVAYVGISDFLGDYLVEDFAELIHGITENGIRKLTIDLRGNGGGSFDAVMTMAELFVPAGKTMCYLRTKNMTEPEPLVSEGGGAVFDSVSVIVDGGTASAAELMASILRHCVGAKLYGETTFGKAVGQTVFDLSETEYVTVTTYEIFDADGKSYNEIGLTPDLEIGNVERLFDFPTSLAVFNHTNYKTIEPGVYSDACLALEQRLALVGYLRDAQADGIWDENTRLALLVFQNANMGSGTGTLDDRTVTVITNVINSYKARTYYEDTQLEAALLYHSSFDQTKRLKEEKKKLAASEKAHIEEAYARMEALTE